MLSHDGNLGYFFAHLGRVKSVHNSDVFWPDVVPQERHLPTLDKFCQVIVCETLDLLGHVFEGALQPETERLVVWLRPQHHPVVLHKNERET